MNRTHQFRLINFFDFIYSTSRYHDRMSLINLARCMRKLYLDFYNMGIITLYRLKPNSLINLSIIKSLTFLLYPNSKKAREGLQDYIILD